MIRFYNGKVLTCADGDWKVHSDYEVRVDMDRIVYVGSKDEKKRTEADREIDLHGNLLMPGFKDAHTHSPMTFLRSYADDLPLQEWLYQQVFPMEDQLTPELIYEFTKLAILEYLTSGITASFDMYVEPEANALANVKMGFRTVLCGTLNDFKDSIPALEGFYKKFNQYHPLISYQLGFHAEYTTSESLLKDLAALANEYQAPVYTHLSETEKEVAECRMRYGKSPVKLLHDLGMWNYGGGGFHGVHVSEEDLEILASYVTYESIGSVQMKKKSPVYIVTNPASNAKLASGIAPITEYIKRGIPLAIGTDGPASNNALNMFREMYLATVLAKLRDQDASSCPAEKVLYMATVGGAKAMGLHNCDCIAEGKQADLIVIDLQQPNMQPEHNIVKNLVYSGSKQNVKLTMIAGKILYEDGVFQVGEEPEAIYERINQLVKRIKTKVEGF
ncbi:MAG: amidohydrolase [Lachnospiraceae bacterium]|nr:amidohydrolase [Lachnospiraceae bacterium]MBR1568439.1 amidohydrolase [Lachnospiraceae bacterium]